MNWRFLAGLRVQVGLVVLVVTAALYSALGVLGFRLVQSAGRDAVADRVRMVTAELASDLAGGAQVVRITTPDGVVAWVVSKSIPALGPTPGEVEVTEHLTVHHVPVVLEGAASVASTGANLSTLHHGLWVAVPIAAVLSALLAGYAVHRALRQVGSMQAQLASIGPSDVVTRLERTDSGDELDELAGTVNAMLDRIAQGRLAQHQFTSDAAHELRTPLMALAGELELARGGAPVDTAFYARTDASLERLASRIDDLVLLSSLDERPPLLRSDVDLGELARQECLPLAGSISVLDHGAVAQLDRRLIARALTNLVTNALRHATSAVQIEVHTEGDVVVVRVGDDGPGVAPEQRQVIFDRFRRVDDARNVRHGGAGLGLAIVASVAEVHGGDVVAGVSALGGLEVTLTLPRSALGAATSGTSLVAGN